MKNMLYISLFSCVFSVFSIFSQDPVFVESDCDQILSKLYAEIQDDRRAEQLTDIQRFCISLKAMQDVKKVEELMSLQNDQNNSIIKSIQSQPQIIAENPIIKAAKKLDK